MASVKPRLPVSWISDEKISHCTKCNSEFSMLNRRHHCRSCGNIFCSYCCYQYHSLPSYVPSTHSRYCDGQKHRVCDMCLSHILSVKRNKKYIMIFSMIPIPIHTLCILRTVCDKWKRAVDCILGVFKSLHLKIGYQKWTSMERRLIYVHWKEFTGHSRLMIQSIRAMAGILDISEMVRHYKLTNRISPCTHLFCGDQCTEYINHFDLIDLISCFPASQILENQEMEVWIGQIITSISIEWLYMLIPWLIQPFHPPSESLQRIISNNIIPIVCDNKQLAYQFYFSCNFLIASKTDYAIYYDAIIKRFLNMTPFKEDIGKSHDFLLKIKYPNDITEYDFDKICMPFDPSITIKDVQIVNIVQLNTFTMPWVIPIDTYERGIIKILLKHDDLRKDKFVMTVTNMMKQINHDITLNTYHVLPVDDMFGIIEMLTDASTLQEINKESSLTNWIVKNNITKSMLDIRKDFILSCASNCILSFMMGVGDRNLGNILVSKDGSLAHIDFSYILGTDPKWEELTEMRITPGMVDLLGGNTSDHFKQLKITCSSLFSHIKTYSYFWYALFRYLSAVDPPIDPHHRKFDSIELHIEKRLMPEATDEVVSMAIIDIVEKNSGSRVAGWVDSIHTLKSSIEDLIFSIKIT